MHVKKAVNSFLCHFLNFVNALEKPLFHQLNLVYGQADILKEIMKMEQQEANEPMLIEIANGWAAHGKGWAVHGRTREEALENYRKAEQRHREILALPPWYQQVEIQSLREGQYA